MSYDDDGLSLDVTGDPFSEGVDETTLTPTEVNVRHGYSGRVGKKKKKKGIIHDVGIQLPDFSLGGDL